MENQILKIIIGNRCDQIPNKKHTQQMIQMI